MQLENKFIVKTTYGVFYRLWQQLFKVAPPWHLECVKHDLHYWIGGSAKDRKYADNLYFKNIKDMGYPIVALLMFIVLRIGGHPSMPVLCRWGYGHNNKKFQRKYYDRHHDTFVILEEQGKKLNITLKELFGEKHN